MQELSLQYIEHGMNVIPVRGKIPLIENWQKYSNEKMTEPISHISQTGIGLVCGKASNIMAVDIDTDDPKVLELIPPSPIVRRGKKGEVRFFQFNGSSSQSFKFVDIISTGRQVVLPPSIHPETRKPYTWVNEGLLDFDLDYLPELDMAFTSRLERIDGKSGRNNRLKEIAYAMACQGYKAQDIAERLLLEDASHTPPLFTDAAEGMKGQAIDNALRFSKNIIKTAGQNGDLPDQAIAYLDFSIEQKVKWQPKPMPEPVGVMGEIYQVIKATSYAESDVLSMGGAIAIASTVCGNLYQFEGISANVFCLNIADSGTGKSFSSNLARRLLAKHNLISSADFLSSQAVTADIADFQVMLKTNDEFSKLLKLSQGQSGWQSAIPQELCRLWDASNGSLVVSVAKQNENKKGFFERVYHSILASTTFSEFNKAQTDELFSSGLFPRFLFFCEHNKPKRKIYLDDNLDLSLELLDKDIARLLKPSQNALSALGNVKKYRLTKDARKLFERHWQLYMSMIDDISDDLLKTIRSRYIQHYKKLALLHAWSAHDELEVRETDLVWAYEMVEACEHNMMPLLKPNVTEDKHARKVTSVYEFIKAEPNKRASRRDLMRKYGFTKDEYLKIVQTLDDQERVQRVRERSSNGKEIEALVVID
jgi:hypothetical protein